MVADNVRGERTATPAGLHEHPVASWSEGDARWAPDGLHFSPEGYRVLGEGLAGVVRERLGEG